ncbi:MAG: creatininase family protein [Proteobacteria bacterium]|nr:creatininase family protein [Pseudomonadota bacterium]
MHLHDMTMKDFKDGLKETQTLIVPYGTIEAHGTHLPLSTDTIAMVRVCEEAAKQIPVFVAPPIHYGVCTSSGQHPGSLGITPETLRRITIDIVRDGAKKGLKNFILISGHGGGIHTFAMKEAGEILKAENKDIEVAALTIYEILGKEAELIAESEGDSHAGELETSLMLHLTPGLVKGRSPKERPQFKRPFIATDKIKYWPGAVNGDPSLATIEKGGRFFNVMIEKTVGLVREIEKL